MSSFLILAQPPVQPPIAAPTWQGVTLEWEGHDGSLWDLTTGNGGAVLDTAFGEIEGLHEPRITKFTSESYAIPGNRVLGYRAVARDVFWPVLIYADSSDQWNDTYGRFFRSIHPQREGIWRATYAGKTRTLRLTGVYDRPGGSALSPHTIGWARYGVQLEASQPYWEGAPVSAGPWKGADPQNFFGGDGSPSGATPFVISKSQTIGSATITNPGDVPAYPVWTITGELDDVEVGIGDAVISPPDVNSGDTLIIDTNPRNVQAALDGVNVSATVGFLDLEPIPPGESVPVHVQGTGAGSVSCTLVPLFHRAFG